MSGWTVYRSPVTEHFFPYEQPIELPQLKHLYDSSPGRLLDLIRLPLALDLSFWESPQYGQRKAYLSWPRRVNRARWPAISAT